jgi:hypothetical protein
LDGHISFSQASTGGKNNPLPPYDTILPPTGIHPHKIHPYLLRKPAVTRPNQVWAMNITYIPPLGRLLRNRLPIAWQGIENA